MNSYYFRLRVSTSPQPGFLTLFYSKLMTMFNHLISQLSSLEALHIVNYLNLTFDESVSLISGIDTPETANT